MKSNVEKYRQLAFRLYKRTMERGVRWQLDANDNAVEAQIGSQSIVIRQRNNTELETLYKLEIRNSSSAYIDGFTDEQLGSGSVPNLGDMTYYQLMDNLFGLAKNLATQSTIAIDEVLDTLSREENEGISY